MAQLTFLELFYFFYVTAFIETFFQVFVLQVLASLLSFITVTRYIDLPKQHLSLCISKSFVILKSFLYTLFTSLLRMFINDFQSFYSSVSQERVASSLHLTCKTFAITRGKSSVLERRLGLLREALVGGVHRAVVRGLTTPHHLPFTLLVALHTLR